MDTRNTLSFRTSIDINDPPVTVTIPAENILPIKMRKGGKKQEPPSEYLIIGFDTEYQTFKPATKDVIVAGEAKNEVLSYQFSIKVVSRDWQLKEEQKTEGIIIPDEGQRLYQGEFVVAAIGTLIAKYPTIKVPTTVYLVGHFTRADLPAFHEFKDDAKRSLNNVRNTFVSIENHIKLPIVDDTEQPITEFRIWLRDTILLAPANAKALADVGEILGFKKEKLHDDRATELSIKQNMKKFRSDDWERFKKYAIRDAEICMRYAERVIQQSVELFGHFKMPLTLTSFGSKLVLADWKQNGWEDDDVLGRETRVERHFSKKRGYFEKKTVRPFQDLVYFELDFVTEAYHGGRNEQFAFGICDEGDWNDHDLSSAYTTAMSVIGKPDWDRVERLESLDQIEPLDLAFFSVDFEFPSSVRFPTLPVRTSNGIMFPRKGRSSCAAPEIALAKQLGATLTLRRGVRVETDRSNPVFLGFIKKCISERGKHAKNTFENLFWKEVGNSTYGKTAQGLRKKRVYDLRNDDMVELPESTLTQPFFASFITSFTRAVLGEILNNFSDDAQVFSVTTDGFLSNASEQEITRATRGPLFRSFAEARTNLVQDDSPLEIKHRIRQPVGWRTRGSATLKLGSGEKNNIVLQKGGIKSDPLLEDHEENARVVRLFFDRFPEQMMEYSVGVGLKDMVRYGTDFVFRPISKRLSMEFDWKRRPKNQVNRTVDFEGKSYTHLSFETEPLEDFEEFQKVRDAWEKWDKKPRRLLKSVPDLSEFLTYLETNRKSNTDAQRYLSKSGDADITRARIDLTKAFKRNQAGFDLAFLRVGKVIDRRFAEILTDIGIPCTTIQVENGLKGSFTPNRVIRTERVIESLNKLKNKYFHELEIEFLLTQQKP